MKKIFILFPILALLVTGCSLTSKPINNNIVPDQSVPLPQEQANNSQAQVVPSQVVPSQVVPNQNEEANVSEKWVNTPAEIKSMSTENKITFLSIDILSHNPGFLPGVTEFFINQSTKLREVSVDDNTKSYLCGAGPDDNENTADVSTDTQSLLAVIKDKLLNKGYTTYYFDINGGVVQSIYEQCLP